MCDNVLQRGKEAMTMASATMTIRMDESEKRLVTDYARTFGMSASEFMRRSALERIEDELDLEDWKRAKAEFDDDPKTVAAAEIARKYL
jgi:uncharacterized protein (DUF1778 family)